MASGYNVSGRGDLDTLFMARQSAARANVGFTVAGVDLASRFEPIGSATPIAATGFRAVSADLATLFRDINQPLQAVQINDATLDAVNNSIVCQAAYSLNQNGHIDTTVIAGANPDLGNWITPVSAAPGSYRARATQVSSAGSGTKIGTLASWLAISSSPSWALDTTSADQSQWVLTIEIDNGAGLVLDSCQLTLRARWGV